MSCEKYPIAPITLCKNNIPATTIRPNGSCAFVLRYMLPKIQTKIPRIPIFAIDTIDNTKEVGSI